MYGRSARPAIALACGLIRSACREPPEGRSRWTLRLLADRIVQVEYVEQVSYQTVRRALKKLKRSA